jgi:D-alanine-D-alanine ligase-like ATP-grasp enzyme
MGIVTLGGNSFVHAVATLPAEAAAQFLSEHVLEIEEKAKELQSGLNEGFTMLVQSKFRVGIEARYAELSKKQSLEAPLEDICRWGNTLVTIYAHGPKGEDEHIRAEFKDSNTKS